VYGEMWGIASARLIAHLVIWCIHSIDPSSSETKCEENQGDVHSSAAVVMDILNTATDSNVRTSAIHDSSILSRSRTPQQVGVERSSASRVAVALGSEHVAS